MVNIIYLKCKSDLLYKAFQLDIQFSFHHITKRNRKIRQNLIDPGLFTARISNKIENHSLRSWVNLLNFYETRNMKMSGCTSQIKKPGENLQH